MRKRKIYVREPSDWFAVARRMMHSRVQKSKGVDLENADVVRLLAFDFCSLLLEIGGSLALGAIIEAQHCLLTSHVPETFWPKPDICKDDEEEDDAEEEAA